VGPGTELVFRQGEGEPPDYVESVIHIPIPTPVLLNGAPADLAKLFLLYGTDTQGATAVLIKSLEVWDGLNLVEWQDLFVQLPTGAKRSMGLAHISRRWIKTTQLSSLNQSASALDSTFAFSANPQ